MTVRDRKSPQGTINAREELHVVMPMSLSQVQAASGRYQFGG